MKPAEVKRVLDIVEDALPLTGAELGDDDREADGQESHVRGRNEDRHHDDPEGPPPMIGAEDRALNQSPHQGVES